MCKLEICSPILCVPQTLDRALAAKDKALASQLIGQVKGDFNRWSGEVGVY